MRNLARELPFPKAVEQAVDYCIQHGILEDFLLRNRVEAIEMSIFEYDEEKYLKSEREVWRMEGQKEGRSEGEERFSKLLQFLLEEGRNEDITRAITEQAYREQLYQKYHL